MFFGKTFLKMDITKKPTKENIIRKICYTFPSMVPDKLDGFQYKFHLAVKNHYWVFLCFFFITLMVIYIKWELPYLPLWYFILPLMFF